MKANKGDSIRLIKKVCYGTVSGLVEADVNCILHVVGRNSSDDGVETTENINVWDSQYVIEQDDEKVSECNHNWVVIKDKEFSNTTGFTHVCEFCRQPRTMEYANEYINQLEIENERFLSELEKFTRESKQLHTTVVDVLSDARERGENMFLEPWAGLSIVWENSPRLKMEDGAFIVEDELMEQDDIYFHPLIACTSCGLVTKDWKWVENPDDELIYGCCFECEDKVKKEGLGVFE